MAMIQMPSYEFLHAVLEPQLRRCKALAPAFVNLDGADPDSFANRLNFLYKAAHREIDNKQRFKTKAELLRPQNVAVAAVADVSSAYAFS